MNHYYPFGMLQPERHWSTEDHRYGFNGKEMDNDWNDGGVAGEGTGNVYDYGFRIYDPRLGRFMSEDPLTSSYPWYTPYQYAGNMPIKFIDIDGLEPGPSGSDAGSGSTGSLPDAGGAVFETHLLNPTGQTFRNDLYYTVTQSATSETVELEGGGTANVATGSVLRFTVREFFGFEREVTAHFYVESGEFAGYYDNNGLRYPVEYWSLEDMFGLAEEVDRSRRDFVNSMETLAEEAKKSWDSFLSGMENLHKSFNEFLGLEEETDLIPSGVPGIEAMEANGEATVRPELGYYGTKKHGIYWREGHATANTKNKFGVKVPQGQWGSVADLEYASQIASGLTPSFKMEDFPLPAGHTSIVWLPGPEPTSVPATHFRIKVNPSGVTWHGFPIVKEEE